MKEIAIGLLGGLILAAGLLLPVTVFAGEGSTFKSFMSYRAITSPTSRQWEIQQTAWTDCTGLRRSECGFIMVAIGTGHDFGVGDEINITLSSGISFTAIVGDIKSDRHTDSTNRWTVANGCWVEFIIDPAAICATARRMGDMSFAGFEGYVTVVERLENHVSDMQ